MNPSTMGSNQNAIYNARVANGNGLYQKLNKFDLIEYMMSVLDAGMYTVTSEGTIRRNAKNAIQYETPWHHVNPCPYKQCNIDHQVKFNMFGYIPPKCMECWKVVVAPRTVKELFQLVDVEKGLGRPSKCGIELRAYTSRPYGGYFYNNSLDEGRHCYELVRKAVDEHISKDVHVLLKRGCTEYEMIAGNSLAWYMNDHAWQLEETIEAYVEDDAKNAGHQPAIVWRHVHKRWIEYAFKQGDQTYLEFTDGEPLYPPYQTYHEKQVEEYKVALTNNRAHKAGVPEPVTNYLQWQVGSLMDNAEINRRQFMTALGTMTIDPHTIYEHSDYPY